ARDFLDKLVIGNGIAKTAHHCRYLTVEDRGWYEIAEVEDNFDVLSCSVENLDDLFVGHQAEERREVEPGRKRVHKRRMVRRRHLDKAQFRPERRFTDELRVNGNE